MKGTFENPPSLLFKNNASGLLTTKPDVISGDIRTVKAVCIPPVTTLIIIGRIDAPLREGHLGLVLPTPAYSEILVDSLNYVRKAHNVLLKVKNTSYLKSIKIGEGQVIAI